MLTAIFNIDLRNSLIQNYSIEFGVDAIATRHSNFWRRKISRSRVSDSNRIYRSVDSCCSCCRICIAESTYGKSKVVSNIYTTNTCSRNGNYISQCIGRPSISDCYATNVVTDNLNRKFDINATSRSNTLLSNSCIHLVGWIITRVLGCDADSSHRSIIRII